MGVGPIPCHREGCCARNALTIDDIGLFEINEAFAVQVLAFLDHFGIADDDARVNPYGGAIAFGHPLASSGRAADDAARPPLRASAPTSATASPPCASASAWAAPSSGRTRTERPESTSETLDVPQRALRATRSSPQAHVRDVELPCGAGTMALITLDNGFDHTKPNTFGPARADSR